MSKATYNRTLNIEDTGNGKSTLSIPRVDLEYFNQQCKNFGNRSAYFSHIANFYLPRIADWKKVLHASHQPNWNTVYQKKEQDLQKKNFSPSLQDWELFRQVAGSCGVSICFLFVFLLGLERKKFSKSQPKINTKRGWNSAPKREFLARKVFWVVEFQRKFDRRRQKIHRKLLFG